MAINGINSYGMNFYNYQSTINNMRLTQSLSGNSKLNQYASSPAFAGNSTLKSSMNFIKEYSSSMSALLGAASQLKSSNATSPMNTLTVNSSDTSVATASAKFKVQSMKDITLDVTQLAQAQSNVSTGVTASAKASDNMNFAIQTASGSLNVSVNSAYENGTVKTNAQMLQEAARQINGSKAGVTANVIQKDGNVSLEITGNATGAANAFNISGDLGAAAGIDKTAVEAADAEYSVTTNGSTTSYRSSTNDISVDFTRIGVSLKGTGKTTIQADVDTEKVSSAIGNLVDKYNASLKLLNDNYERGTGVDKQLRNLIAGLGSEQSLEKLGITINKDATLSFDKDVFAKSMKNDPDLTKKLISGAGGLADKAFNKAMTGINTNSNSLINGDVETLQTESLSNPYNVFSMYSHSGPYTLSNYYAVGMMMNYLV